MHTNPTFRWGLPSGCVCVWLKYISQDPTCIPGESAGYLPLSPLLAERSDEIKPASVISGCGRVQRYWLMEKDSCRYQIMPSYLDYFVIETNLCWWWYAISASAELFQWYHCNSWALPHTNLFSLLTRQIPTLGQWPSASDTDARKHPLTSLWDLHCKANRVTVRRSEQLYKRGESPLWALWEGRLTGSNIHGTFTQEPHVYPIS